MKLPLVLLVAGAIGLTASVGAFQSAVRAEPKTQSTYYANGQIQSESTVDNGRRDGLFRRWYADGTKMTEGQYRDGEMDGTWTSWLPDGTLDAARSGTYRLGQRIAD